MAYQLSSACSTSAARVGFLGSDLYFSVSAQAVLAAHTLKHRGRLAQMLGKIFLKKKNSCVSGTVPGVGDSAVNKADENPTATPFLSISG